MSIENESVGVIQDSNDSTKYCIECGAKMSKTQRVCPACGETQT